MEKRRVRRNKGENRTQLIERLKKKKKNNLLLKQANEEIQNKTGKEYFFKYNSINKKDFIKREEDSREELEKKRLFAEKEIVRVEKKLKSFPKIKSKRIVFDDEGEKKCEEVEEKASEEREEYEKYLEQLVETKNKIERKLNA